MLLRRLLEWRDVAHPILRERYPDDPWSQKGAAIPMHCHCLDLDDAWGVPWDDAVLAARESAGIGHVLLHGRDQKPPEYWCIEITDAGADWIRAHDMLGEIEQEQAYTPPPAAPGHSEEGAKDAE